MPLQPLFSRQTPAFGLGVILVNTLEDLLISDNYSYRPVASAMNVTITRTHKQVNTSG
jgi:hypothetical protein